MANLSDTIRDNFPKKKIVIVGDLVADQFLRGTIARVSREAPVFILKHDETKTLAGGAANAAVNNGTWYYLKSSDGSFSSFQFGRAGDLPTPGDYDGDGKTDFAVWRPNANPSQTGVFYIQKSTAGFSAFGWGNSQMKIPANSILPE
jgi:hypothetical protein